MNIFVIKITFNFKTRDYFGLLTLLESKVQPDPVALFVLTLYGCFASSSLFFCL